VWGWSDGTAIGIVELGNVAIRRLINRITPDATTRFDHGMAVISVPLTDLTAKSAVSAAINFPSVAP
jgi:hypothetical protein